MKKAFARRYAAAAFGVLLMLLPVPAALAEDGNTESTGVTTTVWTVAEELELEEWQQVVNSLSGGQRINVREIMNTILSGEQVVSADDVLQLLLEAFVDLLLDRRGLMVRLLAPALLCGLLARLQDAFSSRVVTEVCHWACYLVVAAVVVQECITQISVSRSAVDGMASGMQALFPVLLTLLIAVGGTSSAAFFQPAVVAASGTMTTLVRNVSFSLALAYAVLVVLDNISENFSLSRLSGLIKTLANWTLGVCFTVFIGVMAVQGFGSASMDGVTIRTAKYAVDNFVPVVGGMVADTMDTLVGCTLLVKNALGVTGMLLLVVYLATPLLGVLSTVLVLRLVAAVLQPIADTRVVQCMEDASGALVMLVTTQLCIAAMFLLLIAQLLVVGNMTVMLR